VGEDDDDEDEDEDDDDEDENQDNEDEVRSMEHGKSIYETLDFIFWNGCVLEDACPYTGIAVPPRPLAERAHDV
jgi:hypothetical protein